MRVRIIEVSPGDAYSDVPVAGLTGNFIAHRVWPEGWSAGLFIRDDGVKDPNGEDYYFFEVKVEEI